LWENEDKRELEEMLIKLDTLDNAEEREHYKQLLTKWHTQEKNKERSHSRKRDFRTLEKLETPKMTEKERYKPSPITKLRFQERFEDIIFSQSPCDLHELVSDGTLSRIIEGLTPSQKEALFHIAALRYTTAETAELLGVSERNIRKLYATALYHIRGKIYPIIKFRRKLETDEKYQDIAKERSIYTTHSERKFMDTANEKVRGYYGKMTGE